MPPSRSSWPAIAPPWTKLLVLDTNRDRAELTVLPGVLARMWNGFYYKKPTKDSGTGDYGGNIEVTPDDVLYVGDTSSPELRELFERSAYKGRMAVLQTGWLRVGHVDEYLTTLPTPKAERGYVIAKADPQLGMKLLAAIPPDQLDRLQGRAERAREELQRPPHPRRQPEGRGDHRRQRRSPQEGHPRRHRR